MLNQDHPADERLSALASHDPDASNDVALTAHVASCNRCAALVNQLTELRSALSDLPDLQPHRPLQLVPPLARERSDDAAGNWVRRLFGPAMAAGAVLALVGTIGTATPALDGLSSGAAPGAVPENMEAADATAAEAEVEGEAAASGASAAGGAESATDRGAAATDGTTLAAPDASGVAQDESTAALTMQAERSPWPMVLFAGVALMLAAVLLRWILASRAG